MMIFFSPASSGHLGSRKLTTCGGFILGHIPPRNANPVPGKRCKMPRGGSRLLLGERSKPLGPTFLSSAPQVWLYHFAQVPQQDNSCQAVGTAMDQELPLWRAVEEDAAQLLVKAEGQEGPCLLLQSWQDRLLPLGEGSLRSIFFQEKLVTSGEVPPPAV